MSNEDFIQYFPFAKIRKEQKKAIKFILEEFKTKDYVILEAGTGVGKSAIAVTISRYLNNQPDYQNSEDYQNCSYFLTTQKILQKQYINDFQNVGDIEDCYTMKNISSGSNYKCTFHCGVSCADGLRALRITDKNSEFFRHCSQSCIYKRKKKEFIEEMDGVTNFSYFLAETMYVGEFIPRNLLIIDEAHNCDSELAKFIDVEISNDFVNQMLDIDLPKLKTKKEGRRGGWGAKGREREP